MQVTLRREVAKVMTHRETLKRLSWARLREAQVLLNHGYWSGAYYLSGYAVEFGLKARAPSNSERIPSRRSRPSTTYTPTS